MSTLPTPARLPRFDHIKQHWDPMRKLHVATIFPGELYVTKSHELITTLLGSCIAVCMRDRFNHIGGMNHFKLPKPDKNVASAQNANYGIYAMELLINEILKNGGKRQHLECSVFGGGSVADSLRSDIGGKNIEFVMQFLKDEHVSVIHKDVGHKSAQQVYFHPLSGNINSVVKDGKTLDQLKKTEHAYLEKINSEMEASSIIYF